MLGSHLAAASYRRARCGAYHAMQCGPNAGLCPPCSRSQTRPQGTSDPPARYRTSSAQGHSLLDTLLSGCRTAMRSRRAPVSWRLSPRGISRHRARTSPKTPVGPVVHRHSAGAGPGVDYLCSRRYATRCRRGRLPASLFWLRQRSSLHRSLHTLLQLSERATWGPACGSPPPARRPPDAGQGAARASRPRAASTSSKATG